CGVGYGGRLGGAAQVVGRAVFNFGRVAEVEGVVVVVFAECPAMTGRAVTLAGEPCREVFHPGARKGGLVVRDCQVAGDLREKAAWRVALRTPKGFAVAGVAQR